MDDLWTRARSKLASRLSAEMIETWLDPVELDRVEGEVLVLRVPNRFHGEWLVQHYQPLVMEACDEVLTELGEDLVHPLRIRPVVDERLKDRVPAPKAREATVPPPAAAPVAPAPVAASPAVPDPELNPKYVFESFVVGASNQLAHAASLAAATTPGKRYNPLFLCGGVGLGKTHLVNAIGQKIREDNPNARILYLSAETFTNEFISAIKTNQMEQFRDRYRNGCDVLLMDDIQFIAGKESTQEEFFHTFNALATFNKQIVLASDRPPREMKTLEERLRSRFEGGLVMDIQPPGLETRIAILANWADERGLNVPPSVLRHIAERVTSNVREMEGVFNHMVAALRFSATAATPDLADSLIDGYRRPRRQITLQQVVEVVARHHGMDTAELIGPRRHGPVNQARQIAIYLARELTGASLPQIGDAFGGRTHSTVLHSYTRVVEDLPSDPRLQAIIEDLRRALQRA